jgi:hypothetical protein
MSGDSNTVKQTGERARSMTTRAASTSTVTHGLLAVNWFDQHFTCNDRLGLTDDEEHTLDLFYAERDRSESQFDLRTSLDLPSSDLLVSEPFD